MTASAKARKKAGNASIQCRLCKHTPVASTELWCLVQSAARTPRPGEVRVAWQLLKSLSPSESALRTAYARCSVHRHLERGAAEVAPLRFGRVLCCDRIGTAAHL
eukprot:6206554-Pleurochrysis_carterae.AAC.1